jgi:antitoxin component of RelBE/YafQ-DinJ toxin-antitoxin module
MGKSVEKPKNHIISCRIDDQEMERLQKIASKSGTSISVLMRKTLTMLASNYR